MLGKYLYELSLVVLVCFLLSKNQKKENIFSKKGAFFGFYLYLCLVV